ncbi:DMT family transporter [Chelativorans composti]|jgi:Permeases of the drug/metabolite transporter (DMT) superfamily|uniref:DMT family transporter n=1 Tax=Chelativorans composti TaxID=768533 RepID=A0ABW5DIM2_9HYPH|nr:DMT family transporter [bacterium SGD-2]
MDEAFINSRPTSSVSMQNWSLILLLGAIWGGSFFFARIAVQEIPPLPLVMIRVALAAIALQVWLLFTGPSFRLALPRAGSFFVLATINAVIPFSLMFIGQTEIGAGLASILNATTPFWTAIIAQLFRVEERLSMTKIAGILLGILGTAVMIGPGLAESLGGPLWAKLALIGTAISYGFGATYARRLSDIPAPVVAAGQFTASAIIMVPIVLIFYGTDSFFNASATAWGSVLALSLVTTAFAYLIYFKLLQTVGPTNTSLVTLIVPASAILLGALFLGEHLESFEIAGMALIGFGLLVGDGRVRIRPTVH